MVTWSKSPAENAQIVGATVQKLVVWKTWYLQFVHQFYKPLQQDLRNSVTFKNIF